MLSFLLVLLFVCICNQDYKSYRVQPTITKLLIKLITQEMIIKKAPPVTSRVEKKVNTRQRPHSTHKKYQLSHNKQEHFQSIGPWIKEDGITKKQGSTQTVKGNRKLSKKGQQFILKSHRNKIKQLSIAFALNPEEHYPQLSSIENEEEFVRHADSQHSKFLRSKLGNERLYTHNSRQKLKMSQQIIDIQMKILKSPTTCIQNISKYNSQQLVQRKMSMNKFRTDSLVDKLKSKHSLNDQMQLKAGMNKPLKSNIQNKMDEQTVNKYFRTISQKDKNKRVKTEQIGYNNNLMFYFEARKNNNVMTREKNIMKIRNLMNKKSNVQKADGLVQ